MTNETIFLAGNGLALPAWIMLLAAPAWRWTRTIAMFVVPLALAAAGLGVYIFNFEGFHPLLTSLGAVSYQFSRPGAVLMITLHLLALDLFLGAWMVADARRRNLLHLAVIPCLIVTYILGPVGLLIYIPLRAGLKRGPVSFE